MTFELINRKTTNTLGHFSSEQEALHAYEAIEDQDPTLAEELLLVGFDDHGEAVSSQKPSQLFAV